MIALVEGATRQKTPNEIALTILLSGLTIIFLLAVVDAAAVRGLQRRRRSTIPVLIALLVCLIPTTIGGLLSAIGIAGMDRMIQQNVHRDERARRRGRGRRRTRCCSTRPARSRSAIARRWSSSRSRAVSSSELADRAQLASLPDETPEGRSIVVLAKERFGLRGRGASATRQTVTRDDFVPFSAATRMSGVERRRHASCARRGRRDRALGRARAVAIAADLSRRAVERDRPRGRHAARRRRTRRTAAHGCSASSISRTS